MPNLMNHKTTTVVGVLKPAEKAALMNWCTDNGHNLKWAVAKAVTEFLVTRNAVKTKPAAKKAKKTIKTQVML